MEEEKIISGTTSDEYKNVLGEKETTLLNQEDYILGAICRVGCELDETDSSSLCMLESTNPNILGANADRALCVSCSLTTPSPSILGVVQDESVDGGCSSDGGVTTYYCYFATRANYYGYRASTASSYSLNTSYCGGNFYLSLNTDSTLSGVQKVSLGGNSVVLWISGTSNSNLYTTASTLSFFSSGHSAESKSVRVYCATGSTASAARRSYTMATASTYTSDIYLRQNSYKTYVGGTASAIYPKAMFSIAYGSPINATAYTGTGGYVNILYSGTTTKFVSVVASRDGSNDKSGTCYANSPLYLMPTTANKLANAGFAAALGHSLGNSSPAIMVTDAQAYLKYPTAPTSSKVTQMHVLRGNTSSLPSYYRDDSVATLVEGEATSSISYNEATMDAYGGWSWDGTRWVTTYNGLLMSTESVSIPSNHTYASIETAVWQNAWISLNGNTAQRLDVSLELVVSTSGPKNGIIYSKNLGSYYTTYTNQQVSFGLNSIEPQEALPNDSIITTLHVSVLAHYTLYAYKDQYSQPSTTGLGQIYSPSVGFTIRYGYYA